MSMLYILLKIVHVLTGGNSYNIQAHAQTLHLKNQAISQKQHLPLSMTRHTVQ